MRSTNPFFSPTSLLLSILLFFGLGFTLWRNGGLAFSPGPLSEKSRTGLLREGYASHAGFEKECRLCHQPLQKTQAELCLACHTETATEISAATGLHSRMEEVSRCTACHPDHRGRDFDSRQAAWQNFDHALTSFSLTWHQVDYQAIPMDCAACHLLEHDLAVSMESCFACHADYDTGFMAQHRVDFGEACLDCHDGVDKMARFEHHSTHFPLEGQHTMVRCAGCHENGRFQGTSLECLSCHAEPGLHQGLLGVDCAACHTSSAWKPAMWAGLPFDHATLSGFSLSRHTLDYSGFPLTCLSCHQKGQDDFSAPACVNCHAGYDQVFMDQHRQQFGQACLECHDGVDRLSGFDHANVFPLEGQHAEISCEACHANQKFRGTSSACAGCHAEPPIHATFFGLQCQYCHTPMAWTPAQLHYHTFPLDHGEQSGSECLVCHPDTYPQYTCYGCHDHQPQAMAEIHTRQGILPDDLVNCATCHPDGREAREAGASRPPGEQ